MSFQILNSEMQPIFMGELDREAAAFFGVEVDNKRYAEPFRFAPNWFDIVGWAINQQPKDTNASGNRPKGRCEWSDIIGYICGIAAIGESTYEEIIRKIGVYKPYIELCLHWEAKGYIPVSC